MPTIDTEKARRLGIYCFYDKNGRAAKFIDVFLADLTLNLTDLIVVVNGKVDEDARKMFSKYTDTIIVRRNEGLDVAAHRQVMLELGWERLCEYDEVICLNDTIMGPVYPFREMFEEMDHRDVDFWGITTYHHEQMGKEFVPTHLQAYWHAYRRSLVQSPDFQEYWENLPDWTDYESVTHKHEIPFTKRFEDLGYTWSAYVDSSKYDDLTPYPLLFMPMELIRDANCPIFKRRVFFLDYSFAFSQTGGQSALELFDFLRHDTPYDTDLIWDALLYTYNIQDLRRALHLNYILPISTQSSATSISSRSAFIFHVYFLDLLPDTFRYLASIPENTDLYITTTKEKIPPIQDYATRTGFGHKINYIEVTNRGRDVSALLVGCSELVLRGGYDVIGFAHDKKSSQNLDKGHHGTESLAFSHLLLENTLASKDYVRNILRTFEENPRLGLLTPPPPISGIYFAHTIPLDWGANYDITVKLLRNRLGITNVPITSFKATMSAIGSCYWFRAKALAPLFAASWSYEDFLPEDLMNEDGTVSHAIERANGFVAQSQGYYPAWVLSDKYARIQLDSLWYSTSELVGALGPKRTGETLLELELWTDHKIGGIHQRIRRIGARIHRVLRSVARVTVQRLPSGVQWIIYTTFWGPVSLYRKARKTIGAILRGSALAPAEKSKEIQARKMTAAALARKK